MSDSAAFKQVREVVNEKKFTVKDSGATHRLINHWTDVGLIEDTGRQSAEGWRRLSLLDLVWIQVLFELRKYGVPLKELEVARSAIFDVPDRPGVVLPEFGFAVASCLKAKPRRFLVVYFPDGWAEVTDEETFQLAHDANLFATRSYLVVDLNICCKSVLKNAPVPGFRVRPVLSDEEQAVIESVRSGKYDVVEVHRIDGKIDRIKCRKTTNKLPDQLEKLAKRIGFGDLTVKVQDGVVVLTEVSESKKV